MTTMIKTWSAPISRRYLFEGAVRIFGAATILATAAIQTPQAAKASQKVVKYQETPKERTEVEQVGALCGSERVPDRRWNDQSSRSGAWFIRRRSYVSVMATNRRPPYQQRALLPAEWRWFWKACDQIGAPYGPLFQLLLLTGQRLSAVAGMRRAELSEDGTLWTLATDRTMNQHSHQVPLSPLVRSIIERMPW